MFLKITFLILILFGSALHAQTIHIEYGFNIFSLEINENQITYKKKSYTDSVKKQKCSENLFNNFSLKIKALIKKAPKDDKESGDFMVRYRFDNKTGILSPASRYGKKLLTLSQDFESFRLATEFRCEGEKNP